METKKEIGGNKMFQLIEGIACICISFPIGYLLFKYHTDLVTTIIFSLMAMACFIFGCIFIALFIKESQEAKR